VAGIDLSKLTEKDIQIDGENISITLPRAKLLYINIKPEDIKTAYQDVSLFRTHFSAQEKDELAAQAEKQIKTSLDSLGIFVTAETNASLFINNFLQKTGFKNININFSPVNNRLQ
jgi:NADPH-dependent ferric siderophore reductase